MVSDEVVEAVVSDAAAGGVDLLGPDGVLAELTKRILERALAEEMTDHLGYESGDPMGHGTGNNRNGTSPKQVFTEIGAVDLTGPPSLSTPSYSSPSPASEAANPKKPPGTRSTSKTATGGSKENVNNSREHEVPLSEAAIRVLEDTAELTGTRTGLVFPARGGGIMSSGTLHKLLEDCDIPADVHGARASFRT